MVKIDPKLISRIQDRRGNNLYGKNRKCSGCDKFINEESELPILKQNDNIISAETAYQ